jgi:hypothetical protein
MAKRLTTLCKFHRQDEGVCTNHQKGYTLDQVTNQVQGGSTRLTKPTKARSQAYDASAEPELRESRNECGTKEDKKERHASRTRTRPKPQQRPHA